MPQLLYQRLKRCGTTLIAASGPKIDIFNLENGAYISSWKCVSPGKGESQAAEPDEKLDKGLEKKKSGPGSPEVSNGSGPAAKRRKLSNGDSAEAEAIQKEEINPKSGQGKKKAPRSSPGSGPPNVVLLASTADGQHVVAVTGEDKTIRVFKRGEGDVLEQLSQRVMPKRPCALSITTDDSTIVCGDKFGDVYSLPLIPAPVEPEQETTTETATEETVSKDETSYVPAANQFTVHSQRNLKALENQKKHAKKAKSTERTAPNFEHKLLLGHVSMLTDLALVCIEGRNYILTADRDEHIRISRGIPQSHVIEGYCLGHTEFITRICAPTDNPSLLISGGGEDELFTWDLPSGNLVQKVDLKSHVEKVASEIQTRETSEPTKITVSGIYHVQITRDLEGQLFAVTCEGVPAIFFYFWDSNSKTLSHTQTLRLDGNPLDLISCEWNSSIVVSIDTYSTAGSTTEIRSDQGADVLALQHFSITSENTWEKSSEQYLDTKSVPKSSGDEQSVQKEALTNLLYNLQNLRKQEKEEEE